MANGRSSASIHRHAGDDYGGRHPQGSILSESALIEAAHGLLRVGRGLLFQPVSEAEKMRARTILRATDAIMVAMESSMITKPEERLNRLLVSAKIVDMTLKDLEKLNPKGNENVISMRGYLSGIRDSIAREMQKAGEELIDGIRLNWVAAGKPRVAAGSYMRAKVFERKVKTFRYLIIGLGGYAIAAASFIAGVFEVSLKEWTNPIAAAIAGGASHAFYRALKEFREVRVLESVLKIQSPLESRREGQAKGAAPVIFLPCPSKA